VRPDAAPGLYGKELHRRQEPTDEHRLTHESRVYREIGQYQRDGFHRLPEIAEKHGGAFLCDGVGVGKTFVGLMLLQYPMTKG
jgi:hypothetical protein